MEEEFQVIKDYVGDGDFSLEKGDRVKILEANDDDPTLWVPISSFHTTYECVNTVRFLLQNYHKTTVYDEII